MIRRLFRTPFFPYTMLFRFTYFQSFHSFFSQTLHFRSSALWNVLFPKFSFFDSELPRSFFSQNAAFPEFCSLECLISKAFIFRFLASQKLFFCKTLHFRISTLLFFLFPKFLFFFFFFNDTASFQNSLLSLHYALPIYLFPKFSFFFFANATFPEFCALECLISKVF